MMLPYELRALRLCIDRADDELRSRPDDGTSRAVWRAGTRKSAIGEVPSPSKKTAESRNG